MAKISEIYFLVVFSSIPCCFSAAQDGISWTAHFENTTYSIDMGDSKNISLTITNLNKASLIASNATIRIVSDSRILRVSKTIHPNEIDGDKWSGIFVVNAIFVGHANLSVEIVQQQKSEQRSSQQCRINIQHKSILRGDFMKYFNIVVVIFYFVMYVNIGVILELDKVRAIVRKPLRPCIAFICNFIFSPLVRSYSNNIILVQTILINRKTRAQPDYFHSKGLLRAWYTIVPRQWRFEIRHLRLCIEYAGRRTDLLVCDSRSSHRCFAYAEHCEYVVRLWWVTMLSLWNIHFQIQYLLCIKRAFFTKN